MRPSKRESWMLFVLTVWLNCWSNIEAQQLMPQSLINAYQRILPKTEDPLAREIFDSPDTIWYDHEHLHPRTQGSFFPHERFGGQSEGIRGVSSVYSNPGPNNSSQANREYPWDLTLGGGSHSADNLKTIKAFLLPRTDQGRPYPVVVFGSRPMRWVFPTDTIFAEVAWLVQNGKWYPCEVRLRQKEPDDWRTSRLLPFEDREDLVSQVAQTHPQIAELIPRGKITRLRIRSEHPRRAINSTGIAQELPDFPPELIKRITHSEFVPTEGIPYADNADGPTTMANFHIRPRGDLTANHGTGSREQCRQCHDTIGRHARVFDMDREWYLSVRGSAGIFSWHPWADNIPNQSASPHSLRRSWLQHGIIARFDPKIHTRKHYMQDKFLADELRRGSN